MIVWQKIILPGGSPFGLPGPLPFQLQGLDDADLADLDLALTPAVAEEIGFGGIGFLPVEILNILSVGFVSNAQLRIALTDMALFDDFDVAVGALGDQNMIWRWYFQNYFDRFELLVTLVAAQVGLSSTQLDDLFTLAATVNAK